MPTFLEFPSLYAASPEDFLDSKERLQPMQNGTIERVHSNKNFHQLLIR
jgi:hypothetical protein